ncbi:MAG: VOC family protein [Thermoanaerobaculia bacterium]|nr:VOC family protein [Thermoanaerobaculia bacterium]
MKRHRFVTLVTGLIALSSAAHGQLHAAAEGPIAIGHHHLNVTDVEAHKKFWVEQIGAEVDRLGPMEVLKLPNLILILRERAPSGSNRPTSVNHFGLQVRDIEGMVARLKSAGYPIVTREQIPTAPGDLNPVPDQDTRVAFVLAPDALNVELFENRELDVPVANHHIHFTTPDVAATKAWYVEHLGAAPGMRGSFQAADLPGVNLTFSPSPGEVKPTSGTVLDHIGFEVDGLEGLCQRLEAAGVELTVRYREVPSLGLGIAFFTDPWGTLVELTEGLDAL